MSDKGWKKKGSRIRAARLRRSRLHVFGVRAANGSDCWKRGCSTGTKGAFPKFKFESEYKGNLKGTLQALGMVMQLPEKDELQMTRRQLLAMLDVTMGGRVAEELIFGPEEITTGASSDLQQATRLAREMITRYGMSDKIGLASQDYASEEISSETRQLIEDEVKSMLDAAYKRAKSLLVAHEGDLHSIARRLLDAELRME